MRNRDHKPEPVPAYEERIYRMRFARVSLQPIVPMRLRYLDEAVGVSFVPRDNGRPIRPWQT